ncbi:hypothetical protein [Tolypothrix sp. VBCCA 56010]|uniref:hypothetical protein n=1 Tax=Tolypothrix sp. VBCCA 56010 TaxID=3137731 RepID=UPI003D7D7295
MGHGEWVIPPSSPSSPSSPPLPPSPLSHSPLKWQHQRGKIIIRSVERKTY